MSRLLILILANVCCICSILHAQNVRPGEGALAEAFALLQQQHGVSFTYDQRIRPEQRVQLPSAQDKMPEYLHYLTTSYHLAFKKINSKLIAVTRVSASRTFAGTVLDSLKQSPLAGATVSVGQRVVTKTDKQGQFTLHLSDEDIGKSVIFTYIGYTQVQYTTDHIPKLIKLQTADQRVEEVVISSTYDKPRLREETVGSVYTLTAKELQTDRPFESIDKMLEGLVPGLYVEPSTSLGTPVKIHIRGQGTLSPIGQNGTTSTQPLFVVDGVPIPEQNMGDANNIFNNETLLNPIAGINPSDVESISVLKDAAATSIYGANAANGVILITTRSGRTGPTRFQTNINSGVTTFINRIKLLSGPQYHEVLQEKYRNLGYSEALAAQLAGSSTINTDWFDLITQNAQYTNANISLSGGQKTNNYMMSLGIRDQQNATPGNSLQQYTGSFKYQNIVADKIKIITTITPTLLRREGLDNFTNNTYMPPNVSPYKADGSFAEFANTYNPLAVLAQNEDKSQSFSGTARLDVQYDITPTLYLRGALGGNMFQSKQRSYLSSENATGKTVGGRLRIFDRLTQSWNGMFQIGYQPKIGPKQRLTAIAGTEIQDNYTNLLAGLGTGFTYDRIREVSLARTKNTASSSTSDATVSYYGQLNYDFDRRYYAVANGRLDQSSLFGGDKSMAINGSIGLGWNVSNEHFMEDINYIDFLRLRVSFGSTGNSRIGNYASRGLYNLSDVTYGGNIIATPAYDAAENPDLGWETNYKTNIGIDLNMFERVRISAELYRNNIHNLIAPVHLPFETGFNSIPINTGNMRNQGLDLSLAYTWFNRSKFNWSTSWVAGWNHNKILSFSNPITALYASRAGNSVGNAYRVGYSTNEIWGIRWAGIHPENGEELFYTPEGEIVDRNTILSMGEDAYQPLGNRLPVLQGGMVNNLSLDRLSISFNLQYNLGGNTFVSNTYLRDGSNLQHSNMANNILDRWQQPGDISTVPVLSDKAPVNGSSRYVYDATYLKLSNFSLGYSLPAHWSQLLHIQQASLQFNVTNLFYWYKDKSPSGSNGIKELRFTTPETRTFTFGVRFTL